MPTYTQSGVDIDAAETVVRHIKKAVRSTYSKQVLGDIGAFGAFFDARFPRYKSPVLVSSVDGVGTKLLVAQMMNRHETIGQDLVNHCVNDILVCGARPLFFMDYFACGRLSVDVMREVIHGFVVACKANNCSLVGGETAEMPGLYRESEYDISGSIVGVVERSRIVDGRSIRRGDTLIALPSNGLHTNGFSLARRILLGKYAVDEYVEDLGQSIGEELLRVHRSYLSVISGLIDHARVRGLSHITGGGIQGNTKRIIPSTLSLSIDWDSWEWPKVFRLIQRIGRVPEQDMRRTFNLGVGIVIIVGKKDADSAFRFLKRRGESPFVIGEVVQKKS